MADEQDPTVLARLTNDDRKRVLQWISEKAPLIGKCPTCSQRNWGLLEHFVQHQIFYPDGNIRIGGGVAYPAVALICGNCGNTQLINAVMMNLPSLAKIATYQKSASGDAP